MGCQRDGQYSKSFFFFFCELQKKKKEEDLKIYICKNVSVLFFNLNSLPVVN